MFKQIIINDYEHETRVAMVEDGTVVEIFIEREDESDIAGNIYKGKVKRVLPGMQAAFIDIGLKQAAFIYVTDLFYDNSIETNDIKINLISNKKYSDQDHVEMTRSSKNNIKIEDILTEGQEIIVQISKSPIGKKGARVTTYISLPGKFIVLMPKVQHIGISRKIRNEKERLRLKEIINENKNDPYGYIVRTAAEGISQDKIVNEMQILKNIWKNTYHKFQNSSINSLLHQELNVSLRAVRDLLACEVQKLVIDSREGYLSIKNFLEVTMPAKVNSVEFYGEKEPIFEAYNLEVDIIRALRKKIWLKSGGYIVIEQTEALTAIDVNTGRFVGKYNLEETILKTNLEALREIAYQIRLRDLGGIIIIDFIDMEKKANQEKIYKSFLEAMSKDRSNSHVLPMSEIGIIQMTRKRIRKPINRLLSEHCFYCEGDGFIISKKTICYTIYREIIKETIYHSGEKCNIMVHPEIAELLLGEENKIILDLERKIERQINIFSNQKFHLEQFEIS